MRPTTAAIVLVSLLAICPEASAQPVFRYEGVTDLGGGVYAHDYVLDNTGGAVPVYDVETDFQYYYGWIEVSTPEDWYYYAGPMSKFETEEAPVSVGYEQGGYRITAGTPAVQYGYVQFTDLNHDVIHHGQTSWPMPEPATLIVLAAGAGAILRRRRM